MSGMDIIDYQIIGNDSQYVEIELDPGEAAVGEAGAMLFMEQDIAMETVFGDGSASNQTQGFFGKLMKAGGRLVTGESLFTTVYMHQG
ncbi:MAG TPA: AIM24 family protein, partial [Thiolinea sp.]|nr:AIM24 family protein [Thiolinea sp.]